MRSRINWIDNAKAIGIFLVFYGHYVEYIWRQTNSDVAYFHFKVIYSFHMPFFFMISGFFLKNYNITEKVKKLFLQRMLPVYSFAIFTLPIWIIFSFRYGDSINNIFLKCISYIGGIPSLNFMTWFLVCLFTAEVLISFIGIKKNKNINLFLGIFLIIVGCYFCDNYSKIEELTKIYKNFWYINEAVVAAGFCYLGNYIYENIQKIGTERKLVYLISSILSGFLFFLSIKYYQNSTHVNMAGSRHGEILPFIMHSLLGSVFLLSISILLPTNKIFSFFGRNTLILLGLNGVFFHFINKKIYYITKTFISDSTFSITINCILYSVLSIAICYPFIVIINKHFPQFFGKPDFNGRFFRKTKWK